MKPIVGIMELLSALDNLKHLKRTGWVKMGVPEPETVACHMYRMAVLGMALEHQIAGIDVNRIVRMSLVHDLAEAVVGDITPHCGVTEEDKHQMELKAMQDICKQVPLVGDDWLVLWNEYEEQNTESAVIVKHLDKFDMVAQALDYEFKYGIDLSQFFISTEGFFKIEPFISWDRDIRERRQQTEGEKILSINK